MTLSFTAIPAAAKIATGNLILNTPQNCRLILCIYCRYIASLLVHMAQSLSFESITIKYLETGHTQMEADSMHSAIETAKKGLNVYCPSEWVTIVSNARRKDPYSVDTMGFQDFWDLKALFKDLGHSLMKNEDGQAVHWMKVKTVRVEKSNPNKIYYRESWGCDYQVIDLLKIGNRKERRSTPILTIRNKFNAQLPISSAKYKDLINLCNSGVIPNRAHYFYKGLTSSDTRRNCLPEPDYTEEAETDDLE